MKIAVILDQFFTHDGGAFTFQGELLDALLPIRADSEHTFVVFTPAPLSYPQTPQLSWRLYKRPSALERAYLLAFRYWPGLEDRLGWSSGLERQLRQEGVELAWFLSPRLRGMRLPYVSLVLDLQHRLQPQFPEVSARGEWQRRERHYGRWLPRATAIVAGTEAGRDEISRFYAVPPERVILLPHPTPQAALESKPNDDAAALARLGLQPGYVMYPAQLWFHKNHVTLLRAIALLKQRGAIHQVVFTGADYGSKSAILELIDQLALQEQVHWLGFVEQEDLYVLYRNALALSYVSFFGPENLPPLEAFALGCPVLAARVSGAEEQLGDAALLVDPTSPEEIAAAIQQLKGNDSLRTRLVQAGRKRAAAWTTQDFVRGAMAAFATIDLTRP